MKEGDSLFKPVCLRRGPRYRQQFRRWWQYSLGLQVLQDLVYDRLMLYAAVRRIGNHLGFTAAFWTDRHIDIEYALQALRLYALGCKSWPCAVVLVFYLRFLVGYGLCLVWPASH